MYRSIVMNLLVFSALITFTIADQCPFAPSNCQCSKSSSSDYQFDSVVCSSTGTNPLPDLVASTTYKTKQLSLISDQVYKISDNYLAIFTVIDDLRLSRVQQTGFVKQQFGDKALDGPRIGGIRFSGVSGLLPPPNSLVKLGQSGSLKTLSITRHDDVSLTSGQLKQFESLSELSIDQTTIKDITTDFFTPNLSTLQKLTLARAGWTVLPQGLDQFPSNKILAGLTDLNLSGNRIANVSTRSFFAYTQLVSLNLDENPLADLIATGHLILPRHLTSLSLQGIGLKSIPKNFAINAYQIASLDLQNNQISTLAEGNFDMYAKNLRVLRLDGNPLTQIVAGAFPIYLYQAQFQTIGLTKTRLTGVDLMEFAQMGNVLTDVYLDGNEKLMTVDSSAVPFGAVNIGPVRFHITSTSLQSIKPGISNLFKANPQIKIDISQSSNLQCDGIDWIKQYLNSGQVLATDALCADKHKMSLYDYLSVSGPTGATVTGTVVTTTSGGGGQSDATTASPTKGATGTLGSMKVILAMMALAKMLIA